MTFERMARSGGTYTYVESMLMAWPQRVGTDSIPRLPEWIR